MACPIIRQLHSIKYVSPAGVTQREMLRIEHSVVVRVVITRTIWVPQDPVEHIFLCSTHYVGMMVAGLARSKHYTFSAALLAVIVRDQLNDGVVETAFRED